MTLKLNRVLHEEHSYGKNLAENANQKLVPDLSFLAQNSHCMQIILRFFERGLSKAL